ncbi:MAG: nucleoid occlusion protein [Halanaerobiaceae bacterium]
MKKLIISPIGGNFDMKIPFIQEKNKEEVIKVNIEKITANPYQPRTTFKSKEIIELAESIKSYGVIQPLVVRETNNGYELIAGERRLRACKHLKTKQVPVVIRKINDLEMAEIALVENLQRKDLNYLEEARAYQQLINKFSLTQKELASKIGKSQSTIANKLRLLTLPTDVCNILDPEYITERHARSLLKLEDKKLQLDIIEKIKDDGMTVKETEKYIDKLNNKNKKEAKVFTVYKDLRVFINTLNNSINEMKKAGLKVDVKKKEEDEFVEYKIRLPKEEE